MCVAISKAPGSSREGFQVRMGVRVWCCLWSSWRWSTLEAAVLWCSLARNRPLLSNLWDEISWAPPWLTPSPESPQSCWVTLIWTERGVLFSRTPLRGRVQQSPSETYPISTGNLACWHCKYWSVFLNAPTPPFNHLFTCLHPHWDVSFWRAGTLSGLFIHVSPGPSTEPGT